MTYIERMITVQAPPKQTFEFLRYVENLPSYVPQIRKVNRLEGDRVKVRFEIAGRSIDSQGVFRADEKTMRIEWHADDRHRYSGLLEIKGGDASTDISDVMVHLNVDESAMHGGPAHPQLESKRTAFTEAMLDELQKALELIRRVVQERIGEHHKFVP